MDAKNPLQHIARTAAVFTTALLVLVLVVVVEFAAFEIARSMWTAPPVQPAREPARELTAEQKRTQRIRHARKEFLPDGTLQLVTEIGGVRWRLRDGTSPDTPAGQLQVYDVNDTLLWEGPAARCPYRHLVWAWDSGADRFPLYEMSAMRAITPDVSKVLAIPVGTADELLEMWRYNSWADCFIGYDLQGGRLGYLSAAGLTLSKSDVQPFGSLRSLRAWWPEDSRSPMFLWQTEQRLCRIEFASRHVEQIFESPQSRIERVTMTPWYIRPNPDGEATRSRPLLHCQTSDDVHHVILKDPDQTITVTPPHDWEQWYGNHCEFAATRDTVFLRRTWVEYPAPPAHAEPNWWTEFRRTNRTQRVELYLVDQTGNLTFVNRYGWTVPGVQPVRGYEDPRSKVRPYVTAFSPLLCDLFWLPFPEDFWPNVWQRHESAQGFIEAAEEIRSHYDLWTWLVTTTMLVLTFWHGRPRRTSWARLAFWLVFVALLNVAGFLVYWALHHTPIMACPNCGRRRGLNRNDCVHCQASLPAPAHGTLDLIFRV